MQTKILQLPFMEAHKVLNLKIYIHSCRQISFDTVQRTAMRKEPQTSKLITCHFKTTGCRLNAAERFWSILTCETKTSLIHFLKIYNWQIFECQVHANLFCKQLQRSQTRVQVFPEGRRKASKSPPQLMAEPSGLSLPLPWHHLGGWCHCEIFCFCRPPWHHVKSWFNISVCAESEQVQELGNHFVPTFEYFSSSASWLRCASSFHLPLISPAQDRFAASVTRTGCFITVIWCIPDSMLKVVLFILMRQLLSAVESLLPSEHMVWGPEPMSGDCH